MLWCWCVWIVKLAVKKSGSDHVRASVIWCSDGADDHRTVLHLPAAGLTCSGSSFAYVNPSSLYAASSSLHHKVCCLFSKTGRGPLYGWLFRLPFSKRNRSRYHGFWPGSSSFKTTFFSKRTLFTTYEASWNLLLFYPRTHKKAVAPVTCRPFRICSFSWYDKKTSPKFIITEFMPRSWSAGSKNSDMYAMSQFIFQCCRIHVGYAFALL